MKRAMLLILLAAGCDSGMGEIEPDPSPTGPGGAWAIDPVAFRLNLVVDAGNGITEDIQGSVSGSMSLTESDGSLTGSGTCSWTTRRHTARTGQTLEESGSGSFSVTGSLSAGNAVLVLTGCAWNQIGYRGPFTEVEGYDLEIRTRSEGPLFGSEVWTEARFVSGDNPQELRLRRP